MFLNKTETVKHGKWIGSEIPCEKFKCSVCGGGCWYYDYQADVVKSNYCPNCGAKMDFEVEDVKSKRILSKLYFVKKKFSEETVRNKGYSQVIAMIDMYETGWNIYHLFDKETNCFFFDEDGGEVTEDAYEEPLRECSLKKLEDFVQSRISKGDNDRHLWPLLSLLRAFNSPQWEKENLAVLHYGYM